MICIGLTGGIGSGKTYVAEIFKVLGIPVYESDQRARQLSGELKSIKNGIISLLGEEAYKDGQFNSKWIGNRVFNEPQLLQKLNNIIHPEVETDFINWCSAQKQYPYVIKEAAILFETESYKKLNSTILVTAPEPLRIQRVQERSQLNAEEVLKRMQTQWSDEKKLKLASFVVINDGVSLVLPQVLDIHNKILVKNQWENLENG